MSLPIQAIFTAQKFAPARGLVLISRTRIGNVFIQASVKQKYP
jgi:hypothetical protein